MWCKLTTMSSQNVTYLSSADLKCGRSDSARPLKVLLLNYEFPPSGGGAGNATFHTALEMSRRGHHVDVLTARLANQAMVDNVEDLTIHRVYSRRLGIHESGLFGALTYLLTAMRRMRQLARRNDYDLYHFYFGLPTGLLALYARFVLKKPYIISLRGSDVPGYDTNRWYLQPLHVILRPLSRWLWSNAASVVALSKNLRDLAHTTAPDLEIGVIGNAVCTDLFPQKPQRPLSNPVRLTCVCRLVKRKGIVHLLEAMQELKGEGFLLDIVGTGDQEQTIRRMISDRGLTKWVRMVGYVPRDFLAEHYHASDIFVLPSLSESFGQVLLEAMSCGLPIIASRVGGIPETIEDGVNGLLVEPGCAKSLVGTIRRLAEDPALCNKIGNENARLARSRYSWRAIADSYEEVYGQVIEDTISNDIVQA